MYYQINGTKLIVQLCVNLLLCEEGWFCDCSNCRQNTVLPSQAYKLLKDKEGTKITNKRKIQLTRNVEAYGLLHWVKKTIQNHF